MSGAQVPSPTLPLVLVFDRVREDGGDHTAKIELYGHIVRKVARLDVATVLGVGEEEDIASVIFLRLSVPATVRRVDARTEREAHAFLKTCVRNEFLTRSKAARRNQPGSSPSAGGAEERPNGEDSADDVLESTPSPGDPLPIDPEDGELWTRSLLWKVLDRAVARRAERYREALHRAFLEIEAIRLGGRRPAEFVVGRTEAAMWKAHERAREAWAQAAREMETQGLLTTSEAEAAHEIIAGRLLFCQAPLESASKGQRSPR